MGKLKRLIFPILMVALVIVNLVFATPSSVYAKGSDGQSLSKLINAVAEAKNDTVGWNYETRTYKMQDGGYYTYTELVSTKASEAINDANLSRLTVGAKRDFLTDYYSAALKYTDHYEKEGSDNTTGVTSETMNSLLTILQNKSGVGSTLISSIMSQTKPDFVTANRIYTPFSGTVGTILGLISVLIIAFLAITMVLDIAYIAIPTFQLFVDGDGQGGDKKSFISYEAKEAVKQAQGGGGGSGQDGGLKKVAVFIYLKSRALMLVVLGICILYLVSGNIFALVGWIIDLMSGFLGF